MGTKLAAKIKAGLHLLRPRPSPGETTIATHMFAFHEVDASFVHNQLKQLKTNKAIGLDGISARMPMSQHLFLPRYLTVHLTLPLSRPSGSQEK